MDDRIRKLSDFIFHKTDLGAHAARLCLDLYEGEAPAVDDLFCARCTIPDLCDAGMMAGDVPTFFGGPEKKRLRNFPDIAQSHFTAYQDKQNAA